MSDADLVTFSDTVDAAQHYIERGFAVVPIPPGCKAPVIHGWQAKRFDATHFAPASNIGLVIGEPSGWLVDVDLDAADARELADEILPPTDAVTGRPSSPRSHRWYIAKGATTRKFTDPTTRKMIVELRSTGCQTVVGPSIHPSGEQYEPLTDIPTEIDAAYLLECVETLWREVLKRRGIEAPRPVEPQPPPPVNAAPGVSYSGKLSKSGIPSIDYAPGVTDMLSVETRARAYIDAMPGAVSGCGGHSTTFAAAVALVHGFALDPETAFGILWAHFNPRCSPPWTEKELRHKVNSGASTAHSKPYGWLRDEQGPGYLEHDDSDVDISAITEPLKKEKRMNKQAAKPPDVQIYRPKLICMADVKPKSISWL
jgi:hypothetical protein